MQGRNKITDECRHPLIALKLNVLNASNRPLTALYVLFTKIMQDIGVMEHITNSSFNLSAWFAYLVRSTMLPNQTEMMRMHISKEGLSIGAVVPLEHNDIISVILPTIV